MKKIRVPSLRLHKPTGQAVVTLSGKDFYLGSYDSPEASQRYAKLLAEWEATHRSPTFGEPVHGLTMAQVALAYLEYAKSYHGAESREYYHCRRAIKPISELYANQLANKFGPAEFKVCRQWWMMRQSDGITIADIQKVFVWANQDPFWRTNILCPDKLRKQFATLHAKMSNPSLNHGDGKRSVNLGAGVIHDPSAIAKDPNYGKM